MIDPFVGTSQEMDAGSVVEQSSTVTVLVEPEERQKLFLPMKTTGF